MHKPYVQHQHRPIIWTLNLFNEVINTCIGLYSNIFDINVCGSLSCIHCHKIQIFLLIFLLMLDIYLKKMTISQSLIKYES